MCKIAQNYTWNASKSFARPAPDHAKGAYDAPHTNRGERNWDTSSPDAFDRWRWTLTNRKVERWHPPHFWNVAAPLLRSVRRGATCWFRNNAVWTCTVLWILSDMRYSLFVVRILPWYCAKIVYRCYLVPRCQVSRCPHVLYLVSRYPVSSRVFSCPIHTGRLGQGYRQRRCVYCVWCCWLSD